MVAPRRLAALAALACFASGCLPAPSAYLTEFRVEEILREVDRAARSRDVDGVVAPLAPDAVITFMVKTPAGSQTYTATLRDYRVSLEEAFNAAQDYTYERVDTEIEVAQDRRSATVRSTVRESVTMMGQRVESRTAEVATFEARSDRIVISALMGITQIGP